MLCLAEMAPQRGGNDMSESGADLLHETADLGGAADPNRRAPPALRPQSGDGQRW